MTDHLYVGDIAFWIAACFLAGIFTAGLGWDFTPVFLIALAIAAFIVLEKPALWKWMVVFLCVLWCGVFYYHFYLRWQAVNTDVPYGKTISLTGIVSDEPNESAKFEILTVSPISVRAPDLTVFAQPGSGFHYGDKLQIYGVIDAPEAAGDGPVLFPHSIVVIAEHKGFWLREKLIDFKARIFGIFTGALPSDEASLLGGETIGGTNGMGADLKNEMAISGTSYVVSMYGYKIGVIAFGVMELLSTIVPRRMRFFLALAAIILFAMMVGGAPSVVRGAVMVGLVTAREAGRIFNPRNALTFTAAGMAIWNPAVLTQADFLLSFLSLAGIIYLGPSLRKLFHFSDEHDAGVLHWREAIVISIAALLPIIPIITNAFGDFSLMAFPSNILIFPAVPVAMAGGFILAMVGWSSSLAFAVAKFVEPILMYQLVVIKIFSTIVAPLPLPFNATLVFAAYYGVLITVAYYYV